MKHGVTPSQTVGPFFHNGMNWDDGDSLLCDGLDGERIFIEGQVFDGQGAIVDDALIEIWQADSEGRYTHPEESRDGPPAKGFSGFGRVFTDADGRYRFTTVKPGRVSGPESTFQAPHILVSVFARGLLKHLTTRLYFADEPAANTEDPILQTIEDEAARATLLVRSSIREGKTAYRFDIYLQGDRETLFFNV